MKKARICIGIVFATVVIVVTMNINLTHNAVYGDEFDLGNVEALAQGEGGDGECYGSGTIVCPSGQTYKVKWSR